VLPENYRLCLYGLAAVKQLKFDEAFDYYAAARELAEKYMGAKSVSASMVTGLTARLQYERGDVAGAEVAVLDALDLIEATAFHEGFRNAYFVLVRAAALRGDRARAMSLLNRAERLSWERGWGVVIAWPMAISATPWRCCRRLSSFTQSTPRASLAQAHLFAHGTWCARD
jgi:tetratricopeptide (TPR) repeat protein